MNPIESMTDSTKNQPVVYLVNPDGQHPDQISLPKLLAPLWRWKWIEILIVILSIAASAWHVTQPPSIRRSFVIDSGHYTIDEIARSINTTILPKIEESFPEVSLDPIWKNAPVFELSDTDLWEVRPTEDDPASLRTSESFVLSVRVPNDPSESVILDDLELRIASYFDNLQFEATLASEIAFSRINSDIETAKSELERIEPPDEVSKSIGTLMDQYSANEGLIQSLNDELVLFKSTRTKDVSPEDDLEYQASFDRLSSQLTLMLEKQNDLQKELGIKRSLLRTNTSKTIEVNGVLTKAETNLKILETRIDENLIFNIPHILSTYDVRTRSANRIFIGLGILAVGFLGAILFAYFLEALRLAKNGVMQS